MGVESRLKQEPQVVVQKPMAVQQVQPLVPMTTQTVTMPQTTAVAMPQTAAVVETSIAAPSVATVFQAGMQVEYFSEARGGWIRAVVQGYNAQLGEYVLDVHPKAKANKVRAIGAGGPIGSMAIPATSTVAVSQTASAMVVPGNISVATQPLRTSYAPATSVVQPMTTMQVQGTDMFSAIDRNHDGVISQSEFKQAFAR